MKNQFDSSKLDDKKARIEVPGNLAKKKDNGLSIDKLVALGVILVFALIYLILIIRNPQGDDEIPGLEAKETVRMADDEKDGKGGLFDKDDGKENDDEDKESSTKEMISEKLSEAKDGAERAAGKSLEKMLDRLLAGHCGGCCN